MKVFALLAVLAFFIFGNSAVFADSRPNFLVILCDDLGYGDLECYGHPAIKTPHLNRLAKDGVRFTSCYSAAPVCSASRAGLITGQTPTRIGIYDWIPHNHPMHVRASEITVARLLRDAGYATGHFGKWHCNGKFNSPEQPQPDDLGFQYWFSTQNNAAPTHENPQNFVRNGKEVGPTSGFSCQVVANEAGNWLANLRDKEKPFFAFVCFHEPHEPIASPEDLVKSYPEADEKGEALYYANVTNMDRAVGQLMAKLDELELRENTVVVFTSDNGPETLNRYRGAWRSHGSPGPLRGMKLHIYEGGIRVPGIMRYPGKLEAGTESDVPVCGLDILPTFCEMAGVAIPKSAKLDGTSLGGLFKGEPVQRTEPLFWHYYSALGEAKVAVRDGDWKLVALWQGAVFKPGAGFQKTDYQTMQSGKLVGFELYNVASDIGEAHDVAANHPEITARLKWHLVSKYNDVLKAGPNWFNSNGG